MNQLPNYSNDDLKRIDAIADHIHSIIELLGEDPGRQGLLETPHRAAKALYYLTSGYRSDAQAAMSQALFDHEGSQIVSVRDIEFYSMCEHHILPFFGKVSIAYIPSEKIVGLSKLARVVDICAHKLQVQERLSAEICHHIQQVLQPEGVLVVCHAQHLCMKMRGVEKQDAFTTTIHHCGVFSSDPQLRAETLAILNNS